MKIAQIEDAFATSNRWDPPLSFSSHLRFSLASKRRGNYLSSDSVIYDTILQQLELQLRLDLRWIYLAERDRHHPFVCNPPGGKWLAVSFGKRVRDGVRATVKYTAKSLMIAEELLNTAWSIPVGTLLTRMLVLARDIQDQPLERWTLLELRGYFDTNPALTPDVKNPDYRRIYGDLRDAYGRSIEVSDGAFRMYIMRGPTAELEKLVEGTSFTIKDPEHNAILHRAGIPVDHVILGVSAISGILDGIRTEAITRLHTLHSNMSELSSEKPSEGGKTMVDQRKVFVIHGRNQKLRDSVFGLLRAAGLEPREWNKLVLETGYGSPHNLEVVTKGLASAVAVVALWSGDDLARLRPELQDPDGTLEKELAQPRSNVILETGLALATKRENVVIVRVGAIRNASDLDGLNYVMIQDTKAQKDTNGRKDLLDRLGGVGAAIDVEGKSDWMKEGEFLGFDEREVASLDTRILEEPETPAPNPLRVLSHETMRSGFFGGNSALRLVVLENGSGKDIWRVRLKVTYQTHEGVLGSRVFTLGDQTKDPPILPKGATKTFKWVKHTLPTLVLKGAEFLEFSLTEVPGKATRAVVEIEGFDVITA